jgi:DNA repair protein RecN (Recombination protein N)
MITNLHIKNIGIIDDLSIELNKGFNVLTGETGAGKTLIIDSLGIISGGRFSKDMIRKGENYSFVELCIYDPNNEYQIDGNIIVSREIYDNGRNLCKINDRLVTVNELKRFMSGVIEIHGQNDNQNLLDSKTHLKYLDNFIGKELLSLLEKYKEKFNRYNEIKKELKANYGDEKEKQRKLDLLKYQLNEIDTAKLKKDEEIELEEKRKIFLNSEKISENLEKANTLIGDNSIDALSEAIRSLEKIETIDEKYEKVTSNLKSIYYELQEIYRDIAGYSEETYFNQDEHEAVEERLDLIFSLKRKYGNNIEEILTYKEEIEKEIEYIENLEENNNKLKNELNMIEKDLLSISKEMHIIRNDYAKKLSDSINKELKDLEMKNAKINVKVEYTENEFYDTGKDKVEFYILTNLGEEEKELNKIASGGEMSRIMLAIKKVLSESDQIPILIFDEIDTGISGKAASSVADKLKTIANNHQVLCISHLPTIAASADYNYYISKAVENERTKTNIKLLNENEVIEEIARISSGEVNEVTIKYALELRNKKTA